MSDGWHFELNSAAFRFEEAVFIFLSQSKFSIQEHTILVLCFNKNWSSVFLSPVDRMVHWVNHEATREVWESPDKQFILQET